MLFRSDNALRHGRGRVLLRAAAVDGSVELHVEDEGEGFPPAFLPRAFERFARVPGSGPAEGSALREGRYGGGGAGLGLSIVRAIAQAHGGTAGAANAAPCGADVWLTLPGCR